MEKLQKTYGALRQGLRWAPMGPMGQPLKKTTTHAWSLFSSPDINYEPFLDPSKRVRTFFDSSTFHTCTNVWLHRYLLIFHIIDFRSDVKVSLATYTSLPALGTAKAFYWFSWENQMMTVGIGNILGESALIVYKDQTLSNVNNITLTFNTSLSLSFGYFFGNTGS